MGIVFVAFLAAWIVLPPACYPDNFLRLLRLDGQAKRKEQSTEDKADDFTLHVLLLPAA
jgi:hypothetical protein